MGVTNLATGQLESRPSELTLATCQAHNTVPISRAIAGYLSDRLGLSVRFQGDIDWKEAYRGISSGEIDIGWICGRPYTRLVDDTQAPIRLLAAPVMSGERYKGQPIYFSDVIVRRESPFQRFSDLRGATWACNEPGSQSGYHITRYHLACIGEAGPYFGKTIFSGAHLNSLAMVLDGVIDASAIDSTVLEWQISHDPMLKQQLRIIDSLGPSPIPPMVISGYLADELVENIRQHLFRLHLTDDGRHILRMGNVAKMVPVEDSDYDLIRTMTEISAHVQL